MAADRLLVADKLVEARRMERGTLPEGDGQPGAGVSRRQRRRHGPAAVQRRARPDVGRHRGEPHRRLYFSMNSLRCTARWRTASGASSCQDLIGFLGRRYAYDGTADMSPLTVLIDEFSNVAYGGFIDALNKGGGAKAQFMLAMQSLADPDGGDAAGTAPSGVLDNLNTRVWFRLTRRRHRQAWPPRGSA